MTPSPITTILRHLRAEPSRTWSIVITIFGDALVPRGGSLWLGSLLEIFAGMEINAGVVRTAMSRLAADGWLERQRVGRNSFYRLTETGRAQFATATPRIYDAPPAAWDRRLQMLIEADSQHRDLVRGALEGAGFGNLAPGIWIAPHPTPAPPEAAGMLSLQSQADAQTGVALAARAWPLSEIAAAYQRFVDTFTPVEAATDGGAALSDLDALVVRTLLIHEYRRVVLRAPPLPLPLLPLAWPGIAARRLAGSIYQAVLPASERWLDAHGQNQDGALPKSCIALERRFAELRAPQP